MKGRKEKTINQSKRHTSAFGQITKQIDTMKPWKISDIKLVSANLHFTDEQIGRLIGRTASMVKGFRKRNNILKHTNGFKKGNIPWNKGTSYQAGGRSLEFRFKKGERPNARKMYSVFERIEDGVAQLLIKTPENRQYKYARYQYEKANNCKLSSNDVVIHIDGNYLNCDPKNLKRITRAQNLFRNYNREKQAATAKFRRMKFKNALAEYGIHGTRKSNKAA